jgi:peroxiredoxin
VRHGTLHTGEVRPSTVRRAVFTLLLASGLLTACSGGKDAVDQGAGGQFRYVSATSKGTLIPPAKRKLAGPVSGKLTTGTTYALKQDLGKVVLLNFFASWCGPCKVESPQLDALYRERKNSGVRLVGLDVKDPNNGQLQDFVKNKALTYPIVVDEPARTAIQLGDVPLVGLPATVLIDKQGRVAAVYPQQVFVKDLDPVLDQLVKET